MKICGRSLALALALHAPRELWPEAWAVNSANWQASEFRTRLPPAALPSSMMSKQWQVGQVYGERRTPRQGRRERRPLRPLVAGGQKLAYGRQLETLRRAFRNAAFFRRRRGPAAKQRPPLVGQAPHLVANVVIANSTASEPRVSAGPKPTEVQTIVPVPGAGQGDDRGQFRAPVVRLVATIPVEHPIENRQGRRVAGAAPTMICPCRRGAAASSTCFPGSDRCTAFRAVGRQTP